MTSKERGPRFEADCSLKSTTGAFALFEISRVIVPAESPPQPPNAYIKHISSISVYQIQMNFLTIIAILAAVATAAGTKRSPGKYSGVGNYGA